MGFERIVCGGVNPRRAAESRLAADADVVSREQGDLRMGMRVKQECVLAWEENKLKVTPSLAKENNRCLLLPPNFRLLARALGVRDYPRAGPAPLHIMTLIR